MAVKDYWATINCSRKVVYPTTLAAREKAIEYSAAEHWKRPLVPYHCTTCGKYHLTTARRPDQKKRARRWQAQWEQEHDNGSTTS